jgi:hypothetical protein
MLLNKLLSSSILLTLTTKIKILKEFMDIDWSNPKSQISEHFTVHDATYLPSWGIYHTPSDAEKANILKMAEKMELIRAYIEKPIVVHVWIRPMSVNCPGTIYNGKNYNSVVGGALKSAHILGLAVDWNPEGETCEDARQVLLSQLANFDIRMENRNGNWVHCDTGVLLPGGNRFFRP